MKTNKTLINQPPSFNPKYRADIDGLRAIAVLAVVIYHAFPTIIKGGFIGVDIFFVISGFLISTIIYSSLELEKFTFLGFYIRRIRRIFPSLILVLFACFVFGWFALLPFEFKQLGKHIMGSALFISNFILWGESGYFDNLSDTKPLLHLWSLGIEEQFYIIWPFIAWLIWITKLNRLIILSLITSLSLYLSINNDGMDDIAVFYAPHTRFWELLIGAILAHFIFCKKNNIVKPLDNKGLSFKVLVKIWHSKKINDIFLSLQSIFGLLLILLGFFIVKKDDVLPDFAILPTFGAALLIAAGPTAWVNRHILSNKILVWFGLISFPLYLWHWPLLSFARIINTEQPSTEIRTALVLASILLAWLTYLLVERPLRWGGHTKSKTTILLVLMSILGTVGAYTFQKNGFSFRSNLKSLESKIIDLNPHQPATCVDDNYDKKKWAYYTNGFCNPSRPNQHVDYVLWGDSHAEHLLSGLKASKTSDNFMLVGRSSCPPIIEIKKWSGQYFDDHCKMINIKALEYIINESNVSVVIMSSLATFYYERFGFAAAHKAINFNEEYELAKKNGLPNRKDIFETGLKGAVSKLLAAGKKVVIIKDVPEFPISPASCVGRPFKKAKQNNCSLSRQDYENRTSAYTKMLNEIDTLSIQTYIFDAAAIFCDEKWCQSSDEQHIYFRKDGHHLTTSGSKKVADALVNFLDNANLNN